MKILMIALLLIISKIAKSQDTISLDREANNAVYVPDAGYILPGTVVVLEGDYLFFKVFGIKGTKEKPIRFINKGKVTIGGFKSYTMQIEGEHFIVDGTGDPKYKYGIVLNPDAENITPALGFYTSNSRFYEVHHVELVYAGFQQNPKTGSQPLKGIYLHHNYLHDCTGKQFGGRAEFFYMGSTDPSVSADAPFRFVDCRIENNLMENTTGDGIQVGQGSFIVKNNVLRNFGQAKLSGQSEGIQIGSNGSGIFAHNIIDGGYGHAMIIMGSGKIEVYKNKFKNIDNNSFSTITDAIYINNKSHDKMYLSLYDNQFENLTGRYMINNASKDSLNGGCVFKDNKFINVKTLLPQINNIHQKDQWKAAAN